MSSLCFNEALIKMRDNIITEDEFLQNIVKHCSGIRHGQNELCNDDAVTNDPDYLAFGCNIKEDLFTSAMAMWIFSVFKTPVGGEGLRTPVDRTQIVNTLVRY